MSNLRIIAGKAKGLRLKSVPGDSTRPITDRVKESLFNILSNDIKDSIWLDLFGGTGSVGIEALSRGAKWVRFIDINQRAVATLKTNLKHTNFQDAAEVIKADALTIIKQKPNKKFDYIYIAPPQYKEIWKKAVLLTDKNPGWLTDNAWVIVQIHPIEYEKLSLDNLVEFDQRKYGSTLLIFYEVKI